jgi:hypothetical protein
VSNCALNKTIYILMTKRYRSIAVVVTPQLLINDRSETVKAYFDDQIKYISCKDSFDS